MRSVYIRPLKLEDALISCQWRNNPKLWKYTGAKPNMHITPELETEWLKEALKKEDEKRFAIIDLVSDHYIGNVFLTNIRDDEAYIHIFIGETKYWGGSRALDATRCLLDYAFSNLSLKKIIALIKPENRSSLALSKNIGFQEVPGEDKNLIKMSISLEMYEANRVNNF